MKRKFVLIGLSSLTFFAAFLFSVLFLFAFLYIFADYNLISAEVCLWTTFGCSLAVAIFFLIYVIVYWNRARSSKVGNFLSRNISKLLLLYIIAIIVFTSIKSEIIWSFENMKDIVSLEWTIYGISVTIFLVWDVLILQYLKEKQPQKARPISSIQQKRYIDKKGEFYQSASVLFNSVTLLVLNTLMMIVTTAFVSIGEEIITLAKQNVVIVCFYFCTNSLISLFMDIVRLLYQDKRRMLKETKVTSAEVEIKNDIEMRITRAMKLLKEIDAFDSLDEEQKERLKSETILKALSVVNRPREVSQDEKGKDGTN